MRYCADCEVWTCERVCWACGTETLTYGMRGYRPLGSVNSVTPDLTEPYPLD